MRPLIVALVCGLLFAPDAQTQEDKSTEPIIRGVSYVGLSVSDLDRAVAFYTTAGDLKSVQEKRIEGVKALDALAGRSGVAAKTQMLEGSNAQLRLMQFGEPSPRARTTRPTPVQGPGIMHVCFQVLKERKTYQRFLAAGAKTIGDPEMVQLNPRRQVFYAYAHDPDGLVVEIEHIDLGKRAETNPPAVDHKIRHVCLSTPDYDGLLDFYSAFLEKKPRKIGPTSGEHFDRVAGLDGVNIAMAWYPIGKFELEVNEYISHPTQRPDTPRPVDAIGYNMIVFDVTDVTAAAERVTALGGTVVTEPEAMDGGEIVFARDPDGNLLGLLSVPDDALVSTSRFN